MQMGVKRRALSLVTPSSLTWSLGGISCPLILTHSLFFLSSPKNIIWKFDGLTIIPLAVYHSNNSCRSLSNLINQSQKSKSFPRPMAHRAAPISVSIALGHASANAVKATAGTRPLVAPRV